MSHSDNPTTFFRGLSSRLATNTGAQGGEGNSLITQVDQDRHSSSRRANNTNAGGGSGTGHHAAAAAANANNGRGASTNSSSANTAQASSLIERVRQIRGRPKNTSPLDAAAHPSLLPPPLPRHVGKKCLILDVDETLVHSSYVQPARYDLHLNIALDEMTNVNVFVAYRPYLFEFMEAIAPLFEVVIFTASLGKYCMPLMDAIDKNRVLGDLRLFREHCSVLSSTFVKDLSLLGRNLDHVAIIDNSPVAYLFQQRNAIPITSWFDDPHDDELKQLIPVLRAMAEADTVYDVLDNYNALLQLQQDGL
ncbi:nuclear lim interactor-interacting factor-like protein [Strigomonas culicis]|uniref:Nuclear lim interactor-interacting factor-like protein n=1 Tax=Strigomonas culicis TaxID=28005 RepID=S9W592_9TRYP|nr:nuclear lim interactor-interacting factor-like protein [Strigomonas culicis]|eukprot:EPY34491.1 nuclear lim interactor-interacting factor-like protein [Strigomonas culicis]